MFKITSRHIYSILFLVFVGSLFVHYLSAINSLTHELAAIPAVVALLGALFQILRDIIANERKLLELTIKHDNDVLLLNAQQGFTMGATSHMAIAAFDKHVAFSEAYMKETFNTLNTLFKEGPTKLVITHSAKLSNIRREYAVWLTSEHDVALAKFEGALNKIAAHDMYITETKLANDRQGWVDDMYSTFASVLGQDAMGKTWKGKPLDEEIAYTSVTRGLRKILGTEELTAIRSACIAAALDSTKHSD